MYIYTHKVAKSAILTSKLLRLVFIQNFFEDHANTLLIRYINLGLCF